jgi:hypothetical protein
MTQEQISGLGIESVLLISPKFWPVERERKQDGPSAPRSGAVLHLVKTESAQMPSDQQISILFDIASDGGAGLASSKLPDLMELVANGYVEAGDGGEFYKLTAKGQDLLSE